MSLRRSLLPLLALAAVACNRLDSKVDKLNYALAYSDTRASGADFAIAPTLNVFKSPQLSITSSVTPPDTCIATTYDSTGSSQFSNLQFIDAGPVVTLTGPAAERNLTKVTANSVTTYLIPANDSLPVFPGDSVTLTGPGVAGGFPAFSLRARLAESFTRDSIVVPTSPDSALHLRWTPSNATGTHIPAGSSMLVSLRYSSSTTNPSLNSQIYCFLRDDGAYDVPAAQLSGLRVAAGRQFVMSRWRSQIEQVDNGSYAFFSNTFTVQSSAAPTLMRTLVPQPR